MYLFRACAELTCADQSLDDFRKYWGIKNDFTPEEDAALKKDIEWVEET